MLDAKQMDFLVQRRLTSTESNRASIGEHMHMPERNQLEFHPEYIRLDRPALVAAYKKYFPDSTDSQILEMSRQQLIGLILEQEEFASADEDQSQLSEAVAPPLRYLHRSFELPKFLKPGQGMYYCWENKDAVVEAAVSLAKGDISTREWNLGYDVPEGSLLLTVLGTTPPLVAALESVTTVTEEKVYVDQIAVFSDPISLYDLENLIDSGLPRSSKALGISTAKRVLKALSKIIEDPKPLLASAGRCEDGADPHSNDAVHVLAMLQREYDEVPLCDGCGRDVDADTSVHFFRPRGGKRNWNIQDHVDDAGLLCHDCHALVHGPTKRQLRKLASSRPHCPKCGEGNPRKALWGEPAGEPGDDYVVMGCVLPPGPLTEWICRKCKTPYAVVADPELLAIPYRINPPLESES